MQKLRNYKPFRVFCWNTINGIITLFSTRLLAQTDVRLVALAPIIMSVLSMITKYLNTKYFWDLWVTK